MTSDGARNDLLAKVASTNVRLVVDCSELTYVSSAGLRVFLELARRVSSKQGKLALCSLARQVQQVFELAGLTSLLSIYPTQQDAVAAVK
jgi:anti-anti-sigma factor